VGLGLGIPLLILVGIAVLWYRKRMRRTVPTPEIDTVYR
jgi:hypothetical protein